LIAITGGAGFIGSALAWHFNRLGRNDLLIVDDLGNDQKFRNLAPLAIADYLDKDEFRERIEGNRALPNLEALFHLGACSSTTEQDAGYLMRNNFAYSKSLAEWAMEHDVRFVYASSAATYGNGSTGYDDSPEQLHRLRPLNKYAFSKHVFDQWALNNAALKRIVGLKYFNVYGPNEYHKQDMRSVALKAFEQARASGAVRLFKSYRSEYGDGEQERDFIYVKNAAAVTAWFFDHPDVFGLYNVGTGEARTWNDLARAVFAALRQTPAIEYIEMPEPIRDAYQYSTKAAMNRLRSAGCDLALGTLEAGITDYVQSYLARNTPHLDPEDNL
jgi:ADP-L-glycero-D-manno-heptose 6-epimerase